MLILYIVLFALLLALAVAKQVQNRQAKWCHGKYRVAAVCAFGEAVIALIFAFQFSLPLWIRVLAAILVPIEIISGVLYIRKADRNSKPRIE